MLFNSLTFIFIFLPVTLYGYYRIRRHQHSNKQFAFLIIASLIFYGYWDIRFVPLLLLSIVINFHFAKKLINAHVIWILVTGIFFNLMLIAWFKYAGFFTSALADAGFSVNVINIALPLGISFFTFQQIAYLVDAYQGKIKNHNPYEYTLFVVFFPQLIAGPIVHHNEMIPQFRRQNIFNSFWESPLVTQGLILLVAGLFKKVVVADSLAVYVDPVFSDVSSATFLEAWTAAIGYTLQLYFDFCGYSEMAMGIGLMFGIKLPINFYSPYKATSISDFWRRWHITLGRFLRHYLYIPLGGNRRGLTRLLFAVLTTMFLGGLWHGAGWTFIVWGLLHASYLVINHLWRRTPWKIPELISWWLTFIALILSWVIFRANSVGDAATILGIMVGSEGIQLTPLYQLLFGSFIPNLTGIHSSLINGFEIMIMGLIILFLTRTRNIHERLETFTPTLRHQTSVLGMAAIVIFSLNNPTTFLYHAF